MAMPGYTDPLLMHIMARQGQRPVSPNPGHMGQGRAAPLSLPRDTRTQSAKQKAFQPSNQPEQKKGWWGGFKDRMNLDNQTLLMGGLGLLAGDRYSGPQMMMQNLAYGMDANKADKQDALQQAKMDQFKKGLTPEQAMLFDVAPGAVAGGMAEQMFAQPQGMSYADKLAREKFEYEKQQGKPSFEQLTPKQEIELLGQDMPGSYQRNAVTQEIKPISGTSPRAPLVNVTNNPNQLPNKETLSPLQLKMDEKYADLLVNWNIGGQGDMVKQTQQLEQVLNVLESGQDVTGFVLGSMPDWMLAGINPQAMNTKELVQEVVQRSLRETLGAQFTEKEGAMLLARAYNPRLDEKQNAQRVRRLIEMINSRGEQLNSLNGYMQNNATSAGWDGTLKSANEILSELDGLQQGRTQKRKRWNATTGKMEDVG